MNSTQFTAIIQREGTRYIALCLELDIAGQGNTVEEARQNLAEVVKQFLETVSAHEIGEGSYKETYVSHFEVPIIEAAVDSVQNSDHRHSL